MDPGYSRLRSAAEAGMCAALAVALSTLTLWQSPLGGKVSLEMLPIFVLSRFRGSGPGVTCGLVFGIVDFFEEPVAWHPVQVLLDYPLAFSALAISGLFPRLPRWDIPAVLAGGACRFLCHVLSGILFFKAVVPPGQVAWVYSLAYNASYLVPSLILCAILILPLLRGLKAAL